MRRAVCSIEGCGRKHEALGYCRSHYERLRYHGDPLVGRRRPGVAEAYFRDVVMTYEGDECLIWPFNRTIGGYGRMNGCIVSRRVCEEVNGPAPTPKHDAAHSCGKGSEACVTKRHLAWKTRQENIGDRAIHGTNPVGERNPMAILTDDEVLQIRLMKGNLLQREIASLFGVSRPLISMIHAGKIRTHSLPFSPEGRDKSPAFDAPQCRARSIQVTP